MRKLPPGTRAMPVAGGRLWVCTPGGWLVMSPAGELRLPAEPGCCCSAPGAGFGREWLTKRPISAAITNGTTVSMRTATSERGDRDEPFAADEPLGGHAAAHVDVPPARGRADHGQRQHPEYRQVGLSRGLGAGDRVAGQREGGHELEQPLASLRQQRRFPVTGGSDHRHDRTENVTRQPVDQ
jgi:hypothetical protein